MHAQPPRSTSSHRLDDARDLVALAMADVGKAIRDQAHATRLVFAAVLARGHVLIEDVPGVGKTTLVRAVAQVLGCRFSRVQFTSDLLPGDVLGLHVWSEAAKSFEFRRGPVFAEIVLADEINRAPPKTQSAMLEAMAERRVTVDEETLALPEVFSVLATQNPLEHHGAYPLPESQLDRFAVSLSLGYPDHDHERALVLEGLDPHERLAVVKPRLTPEDVVALQRAAAQVTLTEPVADYLLRLVRQTRSDPEVAMGASPRASVTFAEVARAWAFLHGREYVLPDDIQTLAPNVLAHRLVLGSGNARDAAVDWVTRQVARTPVPR